MVAPRRPSDLDPELGIGNGAADHGFEFGRGGIPRLARQELADQRELAAFGDGDEAAALDAGDEEEAAADQRMLGPGADRLGMRPERREDRVRRLQRVAPERGTPK
jgi:hypothetical protein